MEQWEIKGERLRALRRANVSSVGECRSRLETLSLSRSLPYSPPFALSPYRLTPPLSPRTPSPPRHPHPSRSAPSARLPSPSRGAPRWSGCVVPSSQLISPGLVTRSGLEVELWLRPDPVGVVRGEEGGGRVRSGAVAVNLLLCAADRTAFRSSALFCLFFLLLLLPLSVAGRVDTLRSSLHFSHSCPGRGYLIPVQMLIFFFVSLPVCFLTSDEFISCRVDLPDYLINYRLKNNDFS